jgi:hypothetical protein
MDKGNPESLINIIKVGENVIKHIGYLSQSKFLSSL